MPPQPKPTFPQPAAVLPGEADILANVVADLSDDTAKLVYADWLDEHDDPRGQFLRKSVAAFRAGKKYPAGAQFPQPWRDLAGITLTRKILASGLKKHADKFLKLARPALDYKSFRAADAKIPVGASKLGGLPDLPPGAEWPTYGEEPLAFLGQFNLAELSQSLVCRDMPNAGWLSVFAVWNPDEGSDDFPDGAWRLLHFPGGSKLNRAASGPDHEFKSCRLEFRETITLPEEDSPWKKDIGLGRDDDAWWTYQESVAGFRGEHQILGYPGQIQGDVLSKKTNRHLLTIGPDSNAGWEWGDGGSLYFTIAEAELKAGRFGKVRMEMQCG